MITFDLDDVSQWGPSLSKHLFSLVNHEAASVIRDAPREYFEDTAGVLFSTICTKQDFQAAAEEWFLQQNVAAYHGSRLDDGDIEKLRKEGLLILSASDRRPYILKKLHDYPESHARISEVLGLLGERNEAGHREGQVHATFSRSGLVSHFNHYLRYGSEFDQHAVARLVGDQHKTVLNAYGRATLITLEVPGPMAFKAANPYRTPYNDDLPNPLTEIANVWSNWLINRSFSPKHIGIDCGMIFYGPIDPQWIESIQTMEDSALDD